jgi:hypothetical protein
LRIADCGFANAEWGVRIAECGMWNADSFAGMKSWDGGGKPPFFTCTLAYLWNLVLHSANPQSAIRNPQSAF